MAATAMQITGMITTVDSRANVRRSVAGITPEFYFQKTIDNSRLVKVVDPQRRREIRMFSASVAALFLVMMFYAWQHFSSLEYGYRIEAQKAERERLVEVNRTLQLETASLRDPGRIDALARKMGLESPQPGQVIRLNPEDVGAPIIAQASPVAVIAAAP
ncbi:MAG TPA: cell division protein FtsL [Candidatus Angelobacter sp.]|jgi:cell division protein FtsL|nr:cell division protein FtsL [Candidatus Angelobacter sp.]